MPLQTFPVMRNITGNARGFAVYLIVNSTDHAMGRDIGGGNIRRTNCPPAGSGRLVPRRNLDTTTAQHVDVGSSKDALLAANLVADVSEVRIGRNQTLDLIAVTASR